MQLKQQPGQLRENGIDINSPKARLADLFRALKSIQPVDPLDTEAVSKRALRANEVYVAIQVAAKELGNQQDKDTTLGKAQVIMDAVMTNKKQVSQYLVAS